MIDKYIKGCFFVLIGLLLCAEPVMAKSIRERLQEAREQEYRERANEESDMGLTISTTSTIKKKRVTQTDAITQKRPHVDRIGLSKTKSLYISMETFHTTNGRYPDYLDELTEAKPPYLWRSFFDEPYDYIYEGDKDTYSLHVIPKSGKGTHFYTDESTKIYFNDNAKADKRSAVYE